jgi:hypothetical protein
MEDKLIHTLTNGIKLYTTGGSDCLTNYAKEKGLNLDCYLSVDIKGFKSYILIEYHGNASETIYENQRFEDVAVHIDILSLVEKK